MTLAVNDTPVGDIVFEPNPQSLDVTGPPGQWRLDYKLIAVDREVEHSFRKQFGREFFVDGSGNFFVDAFLSDGRYGINIVRDESPFRRP